MWLARVIHVGNPCRRMNKGMLVRRGKFVKEQSMYTIGEERSAFLSKYRTLSYTEKPSTRLLYLPNDHLFIKMSISAFSLCRKNTIQHSARFSRDRNINGHKRFDYLFYKAMRRRNTMPNFRSI